jgi:hypothetical protein
LVIGLPYPKLPKVNELNPAPQEEIALIDTSQKKFVAEMKYIECMIKLEPYHCAKGKNKDLKRYMVKSDSSGELLFIVTLGFDYGTGVTNFELNPSKFTPEKLDETLMILSGMFNYDYRELFSRGVVSHAEFYVDVYGEHLSDLVLIDTGRRATTHYKGTTYQGKRTSPLSVIMYDKAKEQKQPGEHVRIEARIKRRDIPFKALVELDLFNPLSNLLVIKVNQLHSIANEFKAPQLANHIIELGLYRAVANKHARKEILARIKDNVVPWWQPEMLWASHRQQLQQLKPEYIGGIA